MKILKHLCLTVTLMLLVNLMNAQLELDSQPPVTPEEETEKKELPFNVSGFVDVYYAYSGTDSPLPTSFTESINSFSLGMANVVLSKEGKVGFVADIAVGPRAEVANGFAGTTLAAIKQLFVSYSPSDWLTLSVGNYGTHVGYEVIDAPANINYSTSYMFSNGPFYHTGIKADVAFSETFGAMVGLFDDTDSKMDFVPGKHLGLQLSYAGESTEVYLNYIGGRDQEGNSIDPKITGHQVDLTATFQTTESLGFGVNATTKTNVIEEAENTSWFGAALYANYAFSDAFTLGFRGEHIGDGDGLILGNPDGSVTSFTLSGNFYSGGLTFIPEFRLDIASDDAFVDGEGLTSTMPVFLMAMIYSF